MFQLHDSAIGWRRRIIVNFLSCKLSRTFNLTFYKLCNLYNNGLILILESKGILFSWIHYYFFFYIKTFKSYIRRGMWLICLVIDKKFHILLDKWLFHNYIQNPLNIWTFAILNILLLPLSKVLLHWVQLIILYILKYLYPYSLKFRRSSSWN